MSLLIEIALKTTALFLFAGIALSLLRARSAAVRHGVLALTFACALVAPTLIVLAPVWRVPIPASWLTTSLGSPITFASSAAPQAQPSSSAAAIVATAPAHRGLDSTQIIGGLWIAGTFVSIGMVVAGMWRARRLGRQARPLHTGAWRDCADAIADAYGLRRPVQLLHSAHPTMLVTWGLLRPRILVPASALDWPEDRIRVVLWHELAHVMRHDWPVLIAAGLLRAVHWFNPLVWIAYRRLRQESEQASDDLVLRRGVAAADYASHLLEVARDTVRHRYAASAAIAIAHPSTLEGRVRAMLNERANRTPLSAIGQWSGAIIAFSATMIIAGAGVSTIAAPVSVVPTAPSAAVATASDVPASERQPSQRVERSEPSAPSSATRVTASQPIAAVEAPAQASPGTITGVLYDQLGGLLPGVMVTLVQRPDGARYETLTDRNGSFTFSVLPAGDYEVSTRLPGFSTVINLVKVSAGSTVDRSITLPIGTLQEAISVIGGDGLVRPQTQGGGQRLPRPAPESRTLFSGGIGGQIRVPTKTLHVSPIFPAGLQNASGIVVLEGRVGIDGFLSDLRDVTGSRSSAAHQAFLASALDAVRQWEFTPTLLNNVPVEANITIRVDYSWR